MSALDPVPAGPRPRRRRTALLVALLAVTPALVACDVRLETPPPAALVPDEAESARARTADDAVSTALAADAAAAAATAAGTPVPALAEVAAASRAHLAALGGVYVPTPTPTPTTTASAAEAPATPTEVVTLLADGAASARADAAAASTGELARLLGAVATSRQLLAERLGAAVGAPPAALEPADVPTAVPTGLSPSDVSAVVLSEDALGVAWEVVAARSRGDVRADAARRAAEHRARASAWAVTAEIAATGLDPRRASYDLPAEVLDAAADPAARTAVLAGLEGELLTAYTAAVGQATADGRTALLRLALVVARDHAALTGVVETFPGMPEVAVG